MADTVITTTLTNGVSFGYKRTLTAADVTNGAILFDFQVDYPLVASFMLLTVTTGVVKALTGSIVTYPANGQVRWEDGSVTDAEGDILVVTAQRAR